MLASTNIGLPRLVNSLVKAGEKCGTRIITGGGGHENIKSEKS